MSKAANLRNSLGRTALTDENKEKQHLAHEALLNSEPSNVGSSVPSRSKVDRRRFSFDLRPELHRDLKMQCLLDDTNMYEVVENLIENYTKERNNQRS